MSEDESFPMKPVLATDGVGVLGKAPRGSPQHM